MMDKEKLKDILEDIGSVLDFEVVISDTKVELHYESKGVDVFPTVENAVYSFREMMEETKDKTIWEDELKLVETLEDKLTPIKASEDGESKEIFGYSDDAVLIKRYGLLERVCRGKCDFEELE